VATSMTELVPVRVPLATDLKRFLVLSFIIQPVYCCPRIKSSTKISLQYQGVTTCHACSSHLSVAHHCLPSLFSAISA
jgi:hypothetical protein